MTKQSINISLPNPLTESMQEARDHVLEHLKTQHLTYYKGRALNYTLFSVLENSITIKHSFINLTHNTHNPSDPQINSAQVYISNKSHKRLDTKLDKVFRERERERTKERE